ncbi:MAG: hypothetical protein V1908_01595 [Candidatus Peregrinibacteria bacterium]
MDSLKILIATGVIILLGSFLAGCSRLTSRDAGATPTAGMEDLKQAAGIQKDVTLDLSAQRLPAGRHGDRNQLKVKVTLKNPSQRPITSAQTWLTYDPASLKGVSVDVSQSAFTLTAPFESLFDQGRGLVKLGRGSEKPITDSFITMGELTFEILKPGTTMVSAYDYKPNLRGHVSANVMLDGRPYNVLTKPQSPALIIQ